VTRDYALDYRRIVIRLPTGTRDFSGPHSLQIGTGTHPAFYSVGTGGCYPGRSVRGVKLKLTTQHLLVPSFRMTGALRPLPPLPSLRENKNFFIFLYLPHFFDSSLIYFILQYYSYPFSILTLSLPFLNHFLISPLFILLPFLVLCFSDLFLVSVSSLSLLL
jgi:hypothetical protein